MHPAHSHFYSKMEGQNSSKVAIVMVPFPSQGHLNQLLQLSHLIASYGLPVYYAGSSTFNHQAKLRLHGRVSQSSNQIYFHDLELPLHSSPAPNPNPNNHFLANATPLLDASEHLHQPVSHLLQKFSSKFNRIVVIYDSLMASLFQVIKSIPNVEPYAFIPISAFTKFFYTWDGIPQKPFLLDSDVPKCIPPMDGCFTPEIADFVDKQEKLMGYESGWLYNTSRVIEDKYVELLKKLSTNAEMKHFAIGPLNPVEIEKGNEKHRHVCLEWLDEKETGSVIYTSFGSTTSMTNEQITELAIGLERSGQKFIWVLRRADTDEFFAGGVEKLQLPKGYEERTKDRGMVVRDWAPQLEILAHPSIGGFMSHCGWNSCMESFSMGVPMAAWPLHSDQPRNAVLVTEVLRVGTLVRDWAHRDELVTSTTIENVLRNLMASEEGKKMRKKAAELGDAVRASVVKGGASSLEMDSFISHITR